MTDYESALRLMDDENPDIFKVHLLLETAISQGDDRAEYALATWYLHGQHVEVNLRKGVELLEKAAGKGNMEAAFDLGVCYERGEGVAKSEAKAFGMYEQAAERGDREAMREIGRMLYYGLGVRQDRNAADFWLAKAEQDVQAAEGSPTINYA